MKLALLTAIFLIMTVTPLAAQKRSSAATRPKATVTRSPEIGQSAIVIDENLSVLRKVPSLFSESVHRMSRGRTVRIQGVQEADGVKFYKVTVPPTNFGWVQADAVVGKFRPGDEARLASLVQAYSEFERIETATHFFDMYPNSTLKPPMLLLFGDTVEEMAAQLSRQAVSRIPRKEMAASGAPIHSFYLNFNMLDRYRKLGVIFLFNPTTRLYHYEGASWKEIIAKYPASPEAAEAQKRLDALKLKMEKK